MRKLLVLWAAVFLVAHLARLPVSLADVDSINFALGVRDFDVTRHQPHPPGSPIFIGAAKLATAGLVKLGDPLNAPRALSVVNALGGALALLAIFALSRALGGSPRRAFAATLVAGTIPLYWFTASRPMSDLPGLAAALAAQALLARALFTGDLRVVAAGACMAGLAVGFRLQTATLTMPLLLAVLMSSRLTHRARGVAMMAATAGVLLWLVPLLIDTGVGRYFYAFGDQAREDLEGVEMLATHPSMRLLADALYESFVDPFGHPVLAGILLAGAAAGALVAWLREPALLRVLALGYIPYLLFHLLFQETITNRYALPLMIPVALLFVVAFDYIVPRRLLSVAAGTALVSLAVAVPAVETYVGGEGPGFALIRDLHRMPRTQDTVLAMHQRAAADLRRVQDWTAIPPMRTLPPTRDYEWLELVNLWREGYDGPIWFLADPKRTDLLLIDPQRRRLLRQYGWSDRELPFAGGARPNRIDWHLIQSPGWFLGRGWALSPEIGGLTARDRSQDAGVTPVAWVRRREVASALLLGGRHLGEATDPPIVVRVKVDGRQVDEWPLRPGPFVFMRPLLPEELVGDGTYAHVEIESSWPRAEPPPIAFEQFDLQSITGTLVAYDRGWWEPEYSARTGRMWRWTSKESTLWLFNPGRDLTLAISGEDPTRYYRGGTEMTVAVGEREVARVKLDDDFTKSFTIPAEALSVARGRVTLTFSETHTPDAAGSGDQRELGIRIYNVTVH